MRRAVTSVVVNTRSSELSGVRHTISSRQSPNRSAVKVGVALLWLFDMHSAHDNNSAPAPLVTRVASSRSRSSSAPHHSKKLIKLGLFALSASPCAAERKSGSAADQNSAPGLLATMSAATPRPLSEP